MLRRALRGLRRLFHIQPPGYTLQKSGTAVAGRIRGDLIPAETIVIIDDGRSFVRTGETDDAGFEIYAEGHRTFEYRSHGE